MEFIIGVILATRYDRPCKFPWETVKGYGVRITVCNVQLFGPNHDQLPAVFSPLRGDL